MRTKLLALAAVALTFTMFSGTNAEAWYRHYYRHYYHHYYYHPHYYYRHYYYRPYYRPFFFRPLWW
jgi:hypothetical protein